MIEHVECDHASGFCVWKPLQKIIADCEAYMFMGRAGTVYLYKHCDTRRYLNVDEAGKCYVWHQATDTYRPIEKESAVAHALS